MAEPGTTSINLGGGSGTGAYANLLQMAKSAASATPIGGVIGVAQVIAGIAKQRQANKLLPEADPSISSDLFDAKAEFRRKSKAASTGSAITDDLENIENIAAEGARSLSRSGRRGGYNAALREIGRNTNQALATEAKTEAFYDKAHADMIGAIEERRKEIRTTQLELDKYKYSQALAEGVQLQQDGMANAAAGLTGTLGGKFKIGKEDGITNDDNEIPTYDIPKRKKKTGTNNGIDFLPTGEENPYINN